MTIASGTALGMRAGTSRDVMKVHRMLAHPSEGITRKTAVMMGIETTGQWGACETCFQVKVKRHAVLKKTDERASVRTRKIVERQAVQWVDGPKKTGGDGTGSDDRGMKSAGDDTTVEKGTPQLNVQELGQEQQLTLDEHETQEAFGTGSDDRGMKSAGGGTVVGRRSALQFEIQELELEQQPASSLELRKKVQEVPLNPEKETWEVPWDPEKETREVPLDLKEGTQEASPDPAEETWKAPSDREDEAQGTPPYPAGVVSRRGDTGGAVGS